MADLTELERELLAACRIALRQLEYDGDDKTAFHGAAWEALTKAIASAEARERGRSPAPRAMASPTSSRSRNCVAGELVHNRCSPTARMMRSRRVEPWRNNLRNLH
jgi:hypothetical protein